MNNEAFEPSGQQPAGESGITPPSSDEEPELRVDTDTGEGTGIEDVAGRNSLSGMNRRVPPGERA